MKTNRPYLITEYNAAWKDAYVEVERRVRAILGNKIVGIEHIGSTSIEGMVAKPQVDLLVIVKNGEKVSAEKTALEEGGFTYHGGGYIGHNPEDEYLSLDQGDGIRTAGIHVLPEGNFEIADYLNFRNYLRAHSEDRQRYIDIKKRLYAESPHDYEAYDSGKRELVLDILQKATTWAQTNNSPS